VLAALVALANVLMRDPLLGRSKEARPLVLRGLIMAPRSARANLNGAFSAIAVVAVIPERAERQANRLFQ
jgi:hypothetical protein